MVLITQFLKTKRSSFFLASTQLQQKFPMSKNKTDSANVLIEDEILSSEDLNDSRLYFNRELSWLEFNQRVLEQAKDENHPLLERVKFLAIVQTNMDEFFMVRVAALLKQMRSGSDNIAPDGMSVEEQLGAIRSRVQQMKQDQQQCWSETTPTSIGETLGTLHRTRSVHSRTPRISFKLLSTRSPPCSDTPCF